MNGHLLQKNGMDNVSSEGQSTERGELWPEKAVEKNWCVKWALDFLKIETLIRNLSVVVQSINRIQHFATPRTAAQQAS